MKVAVEGCCHGELDTIYSQIQALETRNKYTVDLLLICGDFQAIRNHQDLQCMAVPDKYKQLGGFYKYYTGEKTAPVLTIVIGGNHEASNYMWELYHGGWLAPNIYYLGEAGCVRVNGVRIAGASGIFKSHDFTRGHFEKMPYDRSMVRSIYHIREYAVRKLSLLTSRLQVFLSHDWPQSITDHGDLPTLLQRKTFLRGDIMSGQLGSPPLLGLLRALQPEWWFAAHLHTRFEACVVHGEPTAADAASDEIAVDASEQVQRDPNEIVIDDEELDAAPAPPSAASAPVSRDPNEIVLDDEEFDAAPAPAPPAPVPRAPLNPDEITLSDLEDEVVAPPPPPPPAPNRAPPRRQPQKWARPAALPGQRTTNFLALDKCGPKRQYLEVVDIPMPQGFLPPDSVSDSVSDSPTNKGKGKATTPPPRLTYDLEWLAISRAFHPFLALTQFQRAFPLEDAARALVAEARTWITDDLRAREPYLDAEDLEVTQVQEFVMTAPGPGREDEVGGRRAQPPWYTNPQTVKFCELIGVVNRINAPPTAPAAAAAVPADKSVLKPGDDAAVHAMLFREV
ncbi:lariat debranching enzyme, C-terminal domain-containing protein [Mycena rosella]|uniref:Lariat debranching enzyme, C-terminal domain-containing protein n=1 Tax=Mycena rosella TaxID=1033263 RepID=A0AAD7CR29_MYCRO|nr:lariat debranching enzyme, C-terminal domain-containing protein [Mycena rosella]